MDQDGNSSSSSIAETRGKRQLDSAEMNKESTPKKRGRPYSIIPPSIDIDFAEVIPDDVYSWYFTHCHEKILVMLPARVNELLRRENQPIERVESTFMQSLYSVQMNTTGIRSVESWCKTPVHHSLEPFMQTVNYVIDCAADDLDMVPSGIGGKLVFKQNRITDDYEDHLQKVAKGSNNNRYSEATIKLVAKHIAPLILALTSPDSVHDPEGKDVGQGFMALIHAMIEMYEPSTNFEKFNDHRDYMKSDKSAHTGSPKEQTKIGIVGLKTKSDADIAERNPNAMYNCVADYSKIFRQVPDSEDLPSLNHHKYIVTKERAFDFYLKVGSVNAIVGEHLLTSGEHKIGRDETLKCMTAVTKSLNLSDECGGLVTTKTTAFVQQYMINHIGGRFILYREDPVNLVQGSMVLSKEITTLKEGVAAILTTLFHVARKCVENYAATEARQKYAYYRKPLGYVCRKMKGSATSKIITFDMKHTTFKMFDGAFNGATEAMFPDLAEDACRREIDAFEERPRAFALAKEKFLEEHDV